MKRTRSDLEEENAQLRQKLAEIEVSLVETITSSNDPFAIEEFLARRWPERWAPTCRRCLQGRGWEVDA
jgi:hypothetical protein